MKNLLFTGASGFLGYNIRPILEKSYDVHTIGLTDDDDIKINIAKEVPPINTHYDVVLHAAGKAHVVPKTDCLILQEGLCFEKESILHDAHNGHGIPAHSLRR